MFIFFFSKAIQYTHSFILECYTPLLLYPSTHNPFLMQTIHLFHCNLCLLFLLYCELYASTLLCYFFSMHIHLYAFKFWYCSVNYMLVLFYATPSLRLYTSTPVHLYTFTPVHLYTSMPVLLFTSTPLHLYSSTPLRLYTSRSLHLYSCTPLFHGTFFCTLFLLHFLLRF